MVIFDKYKVQFVDSDQMSQFWISGTQVFCGNSHGDRVSLGAFNTKEEAQLVLIDIGQAIANDVKLYLVTDPETTSE